MYTTQINRPDPNMDYNETQRKYYDGLASSFDTSQNRVNRCHIRKIAIIENALREYLPESSDGIVVAEIGVGTGIHAEYLLSRNKNIAKYIGVDISENMISVAKNRLRKYQNHELIRAGAESLPIKDSSIDFVFMSGSMHHFSDIESAVIEMRRILKPTGVLAINEPNIVCPVNFIKMLRVYDIEKGQLSVFFPKIFRLLGKNGFRVISRKFFTITPPSPKTLHAAYDFIDKIFEKIPILRSVCSMYHITAKLNKK